MPIFFRKSRVKSFVLLTYWFLVPVKSNNPRSSFLKAVRTSSRLQHPAAYRSALQQMLASVADEYSMTLNHIAYVVKSLHTPCFEFVTHTHTHTQVVEVLAWNASSTCTTYNDSLSSWHTYTHLLLIQFVSHTNQLLIQLKTYTHTYNWLWWWTMTLSIHETHAHTTLTLFFFTHTFFLCQCIGLIGVECTSDCYNRTKVGGYNTNGANNRTLSRPVGSRGEQIFLKVATFQSLSCQTLIAIGGWQATL